MLHDEVTPVWAMPLSLFGLFATMKCAAAAGHHVHCAMRCTTSHGRLGDYSGEWIDVKTDVQDIMRFDDGARYTGAFRNVVRRGRGAHALKKGT